MKNLECNHADIETRGERREQKARKHKFHIHQSGKGLGETYRNVVIKRKDGN